MEKVVCLVSGGIDSPVACALAAESFEVLPLHFCLYPYTCEDNFLTAMKVLKRVKEKVGFEKAIVFPWPKILRAIQGTDDKRHVCLACRKGMFRAADVLCEKEGAVGIVTGESIGQKASQTLPNLAATTSGIKFPILRPLLSFDKVEIDHLSKKLGIGHEIHAGCCYATPKYPCTHADAASLDRLLEKLKIDELISKELKNTLDVKTFDEDFRGYLERLV
jgi:thiamine biosynthesis protein ThiI